MWLPKIPGNFKFNRGDLVNLSAGLSLKTRAKSSSVNFGNPLGILHLYPSLFEPITDKQ